ncbi:MAG TPA: hypothetical protein PKD86_08765 [Gemmatales bacterium]|nr:hypothetical protein [Gemmatales bacterium]HMP59429.1 hypothetical protein [Gemmatales bacterium]
MADAPLPTNSGAAANRRQASDRRRGEDRRKKKIPVAFERRTGADRRQGERRRQVDPTTCEKEYSVEEIEFMRAMELYKRVCNRPFPTWTEVLEVVRALGYRKTEPPTTLPGSTVMANYETNGING